MNMQKRGSDGQSLQNSKFVIILRNPMVEILL